MAAPVPLAMIFILIPVSFFNSGKSMSSRPEVCKLVVVDIFSILLLDWTFSAVTPMLRMMQIAKTNLDFILYPILFWFHLGTPSSRSMSHHIPDVFQPFQGKAFHAAYRETVAPLGQKISVL